MVFVFPWATVFGNHELIAADNRWGWFALTEMFIFLGILILGLVYVWRKGDLEYIKPKQYIPTTDTHIPAALYEQLNLQQSVYQVRPFSTEPVTESAKIQTPAPAAIAEAPVRKPMFKPSFKKPGNDA